MPNTPKPFTPAELSDIEKYGDLREVTAERLVATVKERDETIAQLRACPPERLTRITPDEVAEFLTLRSWSLDSLQHEVGQWSDRTFGQYRDQQGQTTDGMLNHFAREAVELVEAFQTGRPLGEEAADCLLLLLDIAEHSGFSLFAEARAKHARNLTRKWGKPDADGVCEHIREGTADA